MQKIIVGVDGSEGSRVALEWAVREARNHGADLAVLIASGIPPVPLVFGAPPHWEDMSPKLRERLEETLSSVDTVGFDIERRLVEGPAAYALIEASKDADLVVVGSRGHGEFTGMLLGSVSEHCVAHAHCPVVVVRA